MANIQAPSKMNRIYQGPYGNLSVHKTYVKLKAAAVGAVIDLADLPIGLEITGIRVLTDGLGAGVKVTVKSGTKVLASSVDVSSATTEVKSMIPYYVGQSEVDESLTATIESGAATGELHVIVEYTFVGY